MPEVLYRRVSEKIFELTYTFAERAFLRLFPRIFLQKCIAKVNFFVEILDFFILMLYNIFYIFYLTDRLEECIFIYKGVELHDQ